MENEDTLKYAMHPLYTYMSMRRLRASFLQKQWGKVCLLTPHPNQFHNSI